MAGRARAAWKQAKDYVRHDLKETLLPSSMPDPPGHVPPPPRSLRDSAERFVWVLRRYRDTWDGEKMRAEGRRRRGETDGEAAQEQPQEQFGDLLAEFGAAARGGSQAMRPFLQRLYKTRAAAYRDSAQQFIDGYKDGFREAMEPARGGILEDDGATGDDKQGAEAAAVVPIAPPPPPPAPEGTASQPPRTPPNDPSSKTL